MGKFFKARLASGVLAALAVDEAYGTEPTRSFRAMSYTAPGPIHTGFVRVTDIKHRLLPTNAVTYELYLYSGLGNQWYLLEPNKFSDSTEYVAACVADVEYHREVDRVIYLEEPGTIYYVINWSAAPGNTSGYIQVCGERDG